MKKRKILAVITAVAMLFTMIPASVSAATKAPSGEEYLEILEYAYMEAIDDRSKYCDDVWAEIQQVYRDGRAAFIAGDYYAEDYITILESLGQLTWVKGYSDLGELKNRYLNEIDTEYQMHRKADYNEYNWDYIQDGLYVGKKTIKEAVTFKEVVVGYNEAMYAMQTATTKDEIRFIKEEYKYELSRVVNLYLDSDDYGDLLWADILAVYDEAIAAIDEAEQEYVVESLYLEYLEKICTMAKLTFPLEYDVIEKILEEIIKPAMDFYDAMTLDEYTMERLWEAEEIMWDLEDGLYEVEDRVTAEAMVATALKKLKAIPNRDYDESFYKEYVLTVKATGYSGTSIKVSWNANKDLDGYIVYRATSLNGNYKQIKQFTRGKTSSFVDKNLTYGKKYYYKVRGIKSIDFEEKYTKISKATMATPKLVSPVVKLKKVGSEDVKLTWKQVPGADGYQIYRSTSVNGQFKLVKTIKKGDTLTWKDTSTVKGKNYCYKMRAYDVKSDKTKKYSAYSTIKSIKR